MKLKAILLGLALLLAFPAPKDTAAGEPVTVFAAASLTDSMTEIAAELEAQGIELRLSFAASSTLARQIEVGAPADLFFSANELWMDQLEERGLIDPASRVSPIGNSLVLIGPRNQQGKTLEGEELRAALHAMEGPLVMGDPAHVPAGLYAKQALEYMGLWEDPKLIYAFADNVRAALALVETGEADFGIVYATDAAFSDQVSTVFSFPPESHDSITYSMALMAGSRAADAQTVHDFLLGQRAREVFTAYGFVEPD